MQYSLRSKLWVYPGKAGWRFVTLPKSVAEDIHDMFGVSGRGFGSLPVQVSIGKTVWHTSIFPDKKSGSYLLPIKAKVRSVEDVRDDSFVSYSIILTL